MNDKDTFGPILFDESDQTRQIAHLQRWARRVSTEGTQAYCEVLGKGVMKFIELDLLRYGRRRGSLSGIRGFGVVSRSSAVHRFIRSEILPSDLTESRII